MEPWYAKPEWWLVILGFPTLAFLAWQAIETRRTADIAKTSAQVAQASVDAFTNSERSWIMAHVIWATHAKNAPRPTTARVFLTSNNSGKQSLHPQVCLVCKNDGKTPAWITQRSAWLNFFEDLPTGPDTNQPVAFTSSELVTLSVGQSATIQPAIECDGSYPEIGGPGLVLYGVVKYRDAFGNHETWYGYTVHGDPPELDRLVGFPAYNNNA